MVVRGVVGFRPWSSVLSRRMKGGGGGGGGGKRRWRGLAFGVLALVVLSMIVPLAFLLGRFHSTYADGNDFGSNAFRNYDKYESGFSRNRSKSETGMVLIDGWLKLNAPAQTAVLFKELQLKLHSVLNMMIRNPQDTFTSNEIVGSIVNLLIQEEKTAK